MINNLALEIALEPYPVARTFAARFGSRAMADVLRPEYQSVVRKAIALVQMREGTEAAEILAGAFLK